MYEGENNKSYPKEYFMLVLSSSVSCMSITMNNINCITKEVHIFELTIAGLATDWEKGKYTVKTVVCYAHQTSSTP